MSDRSTAAQTLLNRLLQQFPVQRRRAYQRIVDGDTAFRSAYTAADKSLPICSDCGHNTQPVPAPLYFSAPTWSRCCHATIEEAA
jgi:hypothetical protein